MTDTSVLLISGPNLNLLGDREPDVYGLAPLPEIEASAVAVGEAEGLAVVPRQSNHEGEIIDLIHAARGEFAAVIINPGALTHYSWGLHDALAAFDGPVVEVHLSNPASRETWRNTSVVAPVASATIAGLGADGYPMAVRAAALLVKRR